MPYYKAKYLDLEETDHLESAAYFNQLIEFNIRMREDAGKHSILWLKPTIKDVPEIIDLVVNSLEMAEDAKKQGNYLLLK